MTWYSRTASWEIVERTEPTTESLLSTTVHEDVVVAGALPVDREPRCGKGPDLWSSTDGHPRSGQRKLENVALVDREVSDLRLVDGL